MRKGIFIGLILIFLPVTLLLLSLIPITKTHNMIDASFVVEPGEIKEKLHHTVIWVYRSVLRGVVSVEGGCIYFSVDRGKPIYIDHQYNFTIDPASELYTFTFDNTEGSTESLVKFLLKEEDIESLFLMGVVLGWFGVILLAPVGLIILVISYHRSSDKRIT